MENDIQIIKPTFTDREDKIFQLIQYYDGLQHSKSLPEGHGSKHIDEKFEAEFLNAFDEGGLQKAWDIYAENTSHVVTADEDDIDLSDFYEEQLKYHKAEIKKYQKLLKKKLWKQLKMVICKHFGIFTKTMLK